MPGREDDADVLPSKADDAIEALARAYALKDETRTGWQLREVEDEFFATTAPRLSTDRGRALFELIEAGYRKAKDDGDS